jgi:hypothetical protein
MAINDAQNAARLEAERIARENSPYNVRSTAGDELLKKQAAINASYAPARYNIGTPTTTLTPTPTPILTPTPIITPTPVPEVDNFQESIDEAAGMDSTPSPDSVNFSSLTAEEQAAIGGLDTNQGLSVTSNLAVEGKGSYKQDIVTGVLTLDGQPYNGSYNGFDYVDGIKYGATTKQVVNAGIAGENKFSITGSDPTDTKNADAFAAIRMILDSYGIGDELAEELIGYMTDGKGPEEAMLLIKQNPAGAYKKRFAGNELRIAAGLNVLSEKDYLELEDSYANTLKAYGLGNMLSTDRKQNQAMFAKYMGNDLAAPEFKSRIELATDRVINADPGTKETFKKFFPNITDADLVSYFLSPKDTLSKLKEKTTTAEIGGIATSQGLTTSLTSATDLAKFGVDKAAAIEGYGLIKDVLPTSEKLSSIYDEAGIQYNQASGEAEFFKQNQDAKVKRKRLESLERGSFSGSSGNAANAYKTNTAGQI